MRRAPEVLAATVVVAVGAEVSEPAAAISEVVVSAEWAVVACAADWAVLTAASLFAHRQWDGRSRVFTPPGNFTHREV